MTAISDINLEIPLSIEWLAANGTVIQLPPGMTVPVNIVGLHWRAVDPADPNLMAPSDVFTVVTDYTKSSDQSRSAARPTGKVGNGKIIAEGYFGGGRPGAIAQFGYADLQFNPPECVGGRVLVGTPRPIPQI